MAIVDITIIPIGTNSSSVSDFVAEIHKTLDQFKDKVKVQLTPMSTLIEGELDDLFEVIKVIHEVPFNKGAHRVATNIRIDDRRDKPLKMTEKVMKVQKKMNSSS
ncbi:MTH1187 family thiamine-binding protein [Chengkuizengella axinellae]|uniref:MTH1187 family thiamine-binding protein n=1 Tax=Chengkuizengella axinellae TaxID=3064388 RepID=A0ABT9J1S9_9BACL|nr:MTH1187 family thiamine-binding protein [Chengkuizengella sp. 2205SS18-9]MDP5275547.1 MTH1187 family thiamine-binding protein [Chengkuizengella sp. 2205SS18-9]